MKYEQFLLHRIAKLDYGNKFDKNKMNHINPTINFVSRTATNNGVSDYVDEIENVAPYKAGTITLAFGGSVGSTFLQDTPYYTGQNVGVIEFEDFVSHDAKLYITTCIEKVCKQRFVAFSDEINKHFKTDLFVGLPIKTDENGNPVIDGTHKYHDDGFVPDFDYMQERIEKLEQERIEKLEQYLMATGLNDYELSDEDIEVLLQSGFGNYGTAGGAVGVCKKMREFRMGSVFNKVRTSFRGTKKQECVSKTQDDEFSLPLINCKDGNNGIMYYGRREDFSDHQNVLSVIYNGPPTEGQTYFQDEIGLYTDAYLLEVKDLSLNREIGLYLTSAINKSIHNLDKKKYTRGNKATWTDKVENDKIFLPIQTDENNNPILDSDCKYHEDGFIPDWYFMERYIRCIEKIVIADVVKFKDKIIENTKAIVGSEVC